MKKILKLQKLSTHTSNAAKEASSNAKPTLGYEEAQMSSLSLLLCEDDLPLVQG